MKFNFYTKLTHLAQISKDEIHGTKLDSNWIPIWNVIGFYLYFTYYYYYYYYYYIEDEQNNYIAILINEKNSIKLDKLFNFDKIAI